MKLIYQVIYRVSIALTAILTVWAVLFYIAIIEEVNDEMDDQLESYSEHIIITSLSGQELPVEDLGTNNQYFLKQVDANYAMSHSQIKYIDTMIYIKHKSETEPARILVTIFKEEEDQYFELTVSTPTIEKKDLIEAILYWIIFLYVFLLVIIILINIWVFYKSTKPLYILLKWIDNYNLDAIVKPLENDTNISEFKKLNSAVARSLDRGKEVFENQKQFISNASHELQTPLAISLNRLELLMEDETLTEYQLGELIKVSQTLDYISKLNKSLLLLTKIDNHQFINHQPIHMATLINKYLSDFEDIYCFMNIQVEVIEHEDFVIEIEEPLANILIANLIKNAFVHNYKGGNINIDICKSGISFGNTGSEKMLDSERIFERFYKKSPLEGSTGLGLALCMSICQSYNFIFEYFHQRNMHYFKISLK